jgi:hypothetical protein
MLTSLIDITPAADRRGANQMTQQLGLGEHFWRSNAPVGNNLGWPVFNLDRSRAVVRRR